MESLPANNILEFYPDTLLAVRQMYELDKPGEMDEAIDILQEWLKQQKHFLKKDFNREYLERIIITTKGSVERAKARLDKVCTLRTLMPELFGDYDVNTYFTEFHKTIAIHAALPKLTKDHFRILAMKHFGLYHNPNTVLDYHRALIILTEYMRRHDYASGVIFVVDLRGFDFLTFATNVEIMQFRQFFVLLMEGYGVKIKAMHMLSASKSVEIIVAIFKQVLTAKVSARMKVHKTVESIHKEVPKELLPADFGGSLKPLQELHDQWIKELSTEEHSAYRREMNQARTDESLRPTDKFNDQYMGMPGTFRALHVD